MFHSLLYHPFGIRSVQQGRTGFGGRPDGLFRPAQRTACGVRDEEYLTLRILHRLKTLDA
jgi:hypothetical protein